MFPVKNLFLRVLYQFLYLPKALINYYLKQNNIFIIWRKGVAIGDQVLMSGLARSLKLKYDSKIIVLSAYPKLLRLSKWISICLDINKIYIWRISYHILKAIEGERIINYNFPYEKYGYIGVLDAYKKGIYKQFNSAPIWLAHVAHRFNKDIFKNFNCGLSRSNNKEAYILINKIREDFPSKKIGVINPIGKKSFINSKVLPFEKFEKVVELTKNKIIWIQVGENNLLKLKNGTIDKTGRDLIFLVDIIASSDLVFASEGLLNHIASSFPNINSYVSFSYYHPEAFYSYPNTFTVGNPYSKEKKLDFMHWNDSSKLNKNLLEIDAQKIASQILDKEENLK